MSDVERLFSEVYHANIWNSTESRSGEGSSAEAARHLVRELPGLLRRFGVASVLDVPCGDFNWMHDVHLDGVDYVGGDIVPDLIARNQAEFERPGRRFLVLDLVEGPLPRADLVLSRDCFIHLTLPMIFSALGKIVDSGASYLLTSHFPWREIVNNYDIDEILVGGRRVNFEVAPFGLPHPLASIPEAPPQDGVEDKCMALWRTEDVRAMLDSAHRGRR